MVYTSSSLMPVDGNPLLLEFNVLFGNEALNRASIDLKPLILHYLADTYGQPLQPTQAA